MIVQTAPEGASHLVIEQLEHTRMAGRLAAAFGNAAFASPSPKALMEYLVTHHDQGWESVDHEMPQDPETGLPYNLVKTPLPLLLRTGPSSPIFNERHHPYCGLVVSMHTYGLYNGRYGLSDKIFVDTIPEASRPAVKAMLETELERQARLRAELSGRPESREWVEEKALFRNYKLLQFFDTLALYFNMTHEAARRKATFTTVPRGPSEDDVTISVERRAPGIYRVSPYPFTAGSLELTCAGRRLSPQPPGTNVAAMIRACPLEVETVRLEAE